MASFGLLEVVCVSSLDISVLQGIEYRGRDGHVTHTPQLPRLPLSYHQQHGLFRLIGGSLFLTRCISVARYRAPWSGWDMSLLKRCSIAAHYVGIKYICISTILQLILLACVYLIVICGPLRVARPPNMRSKNGPYHFSRFGVAYTAFWPINRTHSSFLVPILGVSLIYSQDHSFLG